MRAFALRRLAAVAVLFAAVGLSVVGGSDAVATTGLPSPAAAAGVAAISAGVDYTCAVTTGGGAKCWGSNVSGQLGNGTTTSYSATPVDVSGLTSGVAAISAGTVHTCAVTIGGVAKCWGDNDHGELGNGTTMSSKTPVDVVGLVPETLTVSNVGTGSGTVTSSPAGIDCGATCSHQFAYGASVTLTATPGSGSTFTGWGGGCTGTGTCAVTTNSATSVTATFTLKPRPKACVVPKVKGKRLSAAKRAIKAHNCSVGKIKHSFSSKVKKGRVISQKPKPGKRLKHGAKVNLVVSKGRR